MSDFNTELWLENPKRRGKGKGKKRSTKKRSTRSRSSYKPNPKKRKYTRRSRRKSNPPGMTNVITDTLVYMAGFVGAPLLRNRIMPMFGMNIPPVLTPVVTGVSAYGLGWAVSLFTDRKTGERVMSGGMIKAANDFLVGQLNFPIGEYRMPYKLKPYAGMGYSGSSGGNGEEGSRAVRGNGVNGYLTPRSMGRYAGLNY